MWVLGLGVDRNSEVERKRELEWGVGWNAERGGAGGVGVGCERRSGQSNLMMAPPSRLTDCLSDSSG